MYLLQTPFSVLCMLFFRIKLFKIGGILSYAPPDLMEDQQSSNSKGSFCNDSEENLEAINENVKTFKLPSTDCSSSSGQPRRKLAADVSSHGRRSRSLEEGGRRRGYSEGDSGLATTPDSSTDSPTFFPSPVVHSTPQQKPQIR